MTRYTPATFRSMGISATEQAEWAALGCTNLRIITQLRLMGVTPEVILTRFHPHSRDLALQEFKWAAMVGSVNYDTFETAIVAVRRADGENVKTAYEAASTVMTAIYGPNGEDGVEADEDEVEVEVHSKSDRYYSTRKLPAARC
jgi:hypothetical protein